MIGVRQWIGCCQLVLLAGPLGTACVTYQRATPAGTARFDLLFGRDLTTFEQRLTAEQHSGAADEWTAVGRAWLALASCQPLTTAEKVLARPGGEPLARFLLATLVLEDVRRSAMLAPGFSADALDEPLSATAFAQWMAPTFFNRRAKGGRASTSGARIHWPAEAEQWADELPAPITVRNNCTPKAPDFDLTPLEWIRGELAAVDAALIEAADLSPEQQHGAVRQLLWRIRLYAATRALRGARIDPGQTGSWYQQSAAYLAPLERPAPGGSAPVEVPEQARQTYLSGLIQAYRGQPAPAIELLARAETLGLPDAARWSARTLRLHLLVRGQRLAEAITLAEPHPPRESPFFGPYLLELGFAYQQSQMDDRLFAAAKIAFQDRAPADDPALRQLFALSLRVLATYPFEVRTIEILEELGPRAQTFARVEQLARVFLDEGRPAPATQSAQWLLAHHHDARHHPRYHSIRALAGFAADDLDAFQRAVADIVYRPPSVLEAVPYLRRADFFASADTELARLFREMLPQMAEWGNSRTARARRQKWLRAIVTQAQAFLRRTDNSVARPSLLELYRVASGLLVEHARGYAQRVGEAHPTPLVLGVVRVAEDATARATPPPFLDLPPPYLLTLIPRDHRAPTEWPAGWPVVPHAASVPSAGRDDV